MTPSCRIHGTAQARYRERRPIRPAANLCVIRSTSLDPPPALLRRLGFRRIRIWQTTGIWLSLYAR
jgi:hypothetical protein